MGVAVTYDALGSTVATFRSGGRYTYGIIGVGYNHKTENNSLVAEGGFGAHIPVTSWFRINNELKASTIGNDSDEPVLNTGYSLIPSFRIGKHIELFGGVGINYMMTKDVSNSKIFPNHSLWKKDWVYQTATTVYRIPVWCTIYILIVQFNTLYTQYPLNLHFDCRFRGFTKKKDYICPEF